MITIYLTIYKGQIITFNFMLMLPYISSTFLEKCEEILDEIHVFQINERDGSNKLQYQIHMEIVLTTSLSL